MRLSKRLIPAALGLVALSVPIVVFAQGPLATRDVPPHGTIYTNAAGMTVYSWQGDTPGTGVSNCVDACANAWPPVLTDDPAMMEMAMTPSMDGQGAIMRTDGTVQVTMSGWPLYLFVRDTAPGDANGQGSTGFGGLWQVVPAS